MSGLYQCGNCSKYYTTSNKIDEIIEKCMDDNIAEVIVKCECGLTHGVGGEKDVFFPESDDKPVECVMMYGFNPEDRTEKIPVLPATMLKETDREDTNFSTYTDDKVIHFEPVLKGVKHASTI